MDEGQPIPTPDLGARTMNDACSDQSSDLSSDACSERSSHRFSDECSDASPSRWLAERFSCAATLKEQRLHVGPASHPERHSAEIAFRDWQRRRHARGPASSDRLASSAEHLRQSHFANNLDVATYVSPHQTLLPRPIHYESPQLTPRSGPSRLPPPYRSPRGETISAHNKENNVAPFRSNVTPFIVSQCRHEQSALAWGRDAQAARAKASKGDLRREAIRSRTEAMRLRGDAVGNWIAGEAGVRPLPDGWTERKESATQLVYYVHGESGRTTWVRPTPVHSNLIE